MMTLEHIVEVASWVSPAIALIAGIAGVAVLRDLLGSVRQERRGFHANI